MLVIQNIAGWLKASSFISLIALSPLTWGFDHQHSQYTQLLQKIVVLSEDRKQSRVDYTKLYKAPQALDNYLDTLSKVTKTKYQSWSSDQQLSFLINAYNGFTLQLINQNFAKFQNKEVESIKDLGSLLVNPWKKSFFKFLGEKSSLDNIEHDMIRVWFQRPRIHVALVCAAVSCPPLRNEAYVADKVTTQLDEQMRLFLSDDKRNTVDGQDHAVILSPIFKWYGADFEKGHQGFNSLKDLVTQYQDVMANNAQQSELLQSQKYEFEFMDYDWRLNNVTTF